MAKSKRGPARATDASKNDFIIGAVILLAIIVITRFVVQARAGVGAKDGGVLAQINAGIRQQSYVVPSDTQIAPVEAGITTEFQSPTSLDGRYNLGEFFIGAGVGGNVPPSSN